MTSAEFANERAWRLLEAALFIALTALLLRQIEDPDIWYHLSIGRAIFTTGGIPEFEFLVFPNAGWPGEFHEWGFGLVQFLAHEPAGFWGMSLVNALLASGTVFLLYRSVRSAGVPSSCHWLALLAAVGWPGTRLVYRSELVLHLACAARIWLLGRYLCRRDWRPLISPRVEVWLGLGRPDQALQAFRTCLRLNPDHHASAARLAELEAMLRREENRDSP